MRTSAEIALREREADLHLLLDSSADGFYAVDREGNTTQCNAAFLRMLGFDHEKDAVGRKLHDAIHHTISPTVLIFRKRNVRFIARHKLASQDMSLASYFFASMAQAFQLNIGLAQSFETASCRVRFATS